MITNEQIEQAFNEQQPTCHTCGWSNSYYEIGFWHATGEMLDGRREYQAYCRNKDDEDSCMHRGYFVYI